MSLVGRVYHVINLLSLDVASGAVIGALFFARLADVQIPIYSLVILFLVVWIIYTVDHLLDIKNLNKEAASERHQFHQQHKSLLIFFCAIALLVSSSLLFLLPVVILKNGIYLSFSVLLYILVRKHLFFLKELVIAVVYVAGIILPAWSLHKHDIDILFFAVPYVLLALTNLIIFSWYDRENDRKDNHVSLATLLGNRQIFYVLVFLFVLVFLCSIYILLQGNNYWVTITYLIMESLLLLLFLFKSFFAYHNYYRLVGDAIFFVPILCILL